MDVREELNLMVEPEFRKFTSRLLPGVDGILGVRLPKLRALAKKIVKGDWRAYLENASDDSYEEIMLQGMVVGYLDEPPDIVLPLIRNFIPKINNWSVCDSFCSGLKITARYPEMMWEFIQPYLRDDREFYIRFGVVMLLSYFADKSHFQKGIWSLDSIHHEAYYVKMAVAWAISIYFVQMPERTMEYLKNNSLDDFTYNKALQKITESRCVDSETKALIASMKRKPSRH